MLNRQTDLGGKWFNMAQSFVTYYYYILNYFSTKFYNPERVKPSRTCLDTQCSLTNLWKGKQLWNYIFSVYCYIQRTKKYEDVANISILLVWVHVRLCNNNGLPF